MGAHHDTHRAAKDSPHGLPTYQIEDKFAGMRIADRPRLAARVVTHLKREISTGMVTIRQGRLAQVAEFIRLAMVASGQGLREALELRRALETPPTSRHRVAWWKP